MKMHAELDGAAARDFGNFSICGFKRVEHLWMPLPEGSKCGVSSLDFVTVEFQLIGKSVRIVDTCECCVVVNDMEISSRERDRFIAYLRTAGCIFSDPGKVVEKAEWFGECLRSEFCGQEVALLKKIPGSKKTLNELEALVLLRGKRNIVEFVGAFDFASSWYIATKFTPHGDLYNILCKSRMSVDKAKRLIKQLLCAVACIHEHGLVHRDIKPENILVMDAACESISLTDFHFCNTEIQEDRCGTLGYCAPELLRMHTSMKIPLTNKIDCWSVGSTFFDLIFGRPLCQASESFTLEAINQSVEVELMPGNRLAITTDEVRYVNIEDAVAAQLLSSLLQLDPQKRVSAKDAILLLNQ